MTRKEKLIEILKNIPDELVNKAYALDLGSNGFRISLEFYPKYLKHYPPDHIDIDSNGFIQFYLEADNEKVEVTMS